MSDALAVVAALREAIAQERSEAVKACLAERKAWARLVKADTAAAIAEQSDFSDSGDAARDAEAKRESLAARQALRDLGVDVDALLGEQR